MLWSTYLDILVAWLLSEEITGLLIYLFWSLNAAKFNINGTKTYYFVYSLLIIFFLVIS